jgi:hypothetical protein
VDGLKKVLKHEKNHLKLNLHDEKAIPRNMVWFSRSICHTDNRDGGIENEHYAVGCSPDNGYIWLFSNEAFAMGSDG